MNLSQIFATAVPVEGGFRASIPETWHQGRTAFGGLSAALALQAAMQEAGKAGGDLPPLRSAQVSFVGPVAGEVEVTARVLRKGRNATWIAAEITSGGAVCLTTTFVFMGSIDSEMYFNATPRPHDIVAPQDATRARKGGVFIDNFDWRYPCAPSEGDGPPEVLRWVRMNEREGLDPMVELLCLADLLPPGVMRLMTRPAPISSMTWICNMLTPEPQTEDGWYLLRSVGTYVEKGCSTQEMTIWNAAGEPVATGMQSVAVFG